MTNKCMQQLLCSIRDLKEETIASAMLENGTRVAIYKTNGKVFVTDDRCTHGNASLADEGSIEGCIVECGLHFGAFDVRNGQAVTAPCSKPLRTYPVEIRDGQVWVALQSESTVVL